MRAYIDLVESAETVTLYRGDPTEIERFETAQTDYGALLGIGIYLTDSPDVAADYTAAKNANGTGDIAYRKLSRDDDRPAMNPKELIQAYLRKLAQDMGLPDAVAEAKSKWQQKYYESPRIEDPDERQAFQDGLNKGFQAERSKIIRDYVNRAKREFQRQRPNLRMVKLTTGEHMFVHPARKGQVVRFEVPKSYVERTLHADRPLPDNVIPAIRRAFARVAHDGREDTQFDLRTLNPKNRGATTDDGRYYGDEHGPNSVDEYIAAYKKHGARYAWTEKLIGGKGENPSLDDIWNGTHSGFSVFYDRARQEAFIKDLQELGYTGFAYDGGIRLAGTANRGGGGILHNAYVFWDDAAINSFRVGSHKPSDEEVGDLHKGIRASSIMR